MSEEQPPTSPTEILPEIPQSEEPQPTWPPPSPPELAPDISRAVGNVARPQPEAAPVEERVAGDLAGLLGQLAQADNQERVLEMQLEDTRRVKERLHGAVLALQKVLAPE